MSEAGLNLRQNKGVTVLAVLLALAVWSWLEARGAESARSSQGALVRQVEQMSEDAARIVRLRSAPRLAAERERPSDELLGQVRSALSAAEVPLERWIGHDPSPAVRVPKTPYKQLAVRLTLEDLTLRQLVQFAFHLTQSDATLSVPYLRLTAPKDVGKGTWDVDMKVSYLIFAPYQDGA
jgi:hypothetical protein